MLGIPIQPGEERRGQHSFEEFEEVGIEIINLAIMGVMNSRTIQALMNVYGYSEEQNPGEPVSHEINAVRMRINKFDDIMRREGDIRKQQ